MPRARGTPVKPWARAKAARRNLSPDEERAAEIRARVLADCHPSQAQAVADPARFFTWLVGRGGGKTTSFKAKYVIGMSAIPKSRFIYVAPTLGMATDLLWDPLKDTCAALDIPADFKEVGKICTFTQNGARLKLVGADDVREMDKQRGQPFDGVGIDEAALFPPDRLEWFIERIITPRLGERRGWLGLASTPGHILRGYFYDRTRPGSDLHEPFEPGRLASRWSSHTWSLQHVAELPEAKKLYPAIVANWNAALEKKALEGWSDDHPIWMREYLGRWAADDTETVFRYRPHVDGELWNRWEPLAGQKRHGPDALKAIMVELREQHPDLRAVVAMDQGYRDPFACNVFAFSPSDPDRRIWHVFAFERTEMYAKLIAELLLGDKLDHGRPEGVFGALSVWPDGIVMDADEALLGELSNVYGIRVAKAEKRADYKFGAIELVNGDLVDGRLKILASSPLEAQLQELQWKEDDFGRKKEDKAQANHSSDTLIYGRKLIAQLFESGAVAREVKPPQPYRDPMGLDAGEIPGEDGGEFAGLLAEAVYDDSGWG
jgi:hypothetical protein